MSWEELQASGEGAPLAFEQVASDHPLWVLYSSGTTGLPKAIVHGHGGILLEHLKNLGLAWDVVPGDRLQWFTTTAWMMWNALVSTLLLRASIVMLDGDPAWPDPGWQWRLAEETRPTFMGVSPPFLIACRRAGLQPGRAVAQGGAGRLPGETRKQQARQEQAPPLHVRRREQSVQNSAHAGDAPVRGEDVEHPLEVERARREPVEHEQRVKIGRAHV